MSAPSTSTSTSTAPLRREVGGVEESKSSPSLEYENTKTFVSPSVPPQVQLAGQPDGRRLSAPAVLPPLNIATGSYGDRGGTTTTAAGGGGGGGGGGVRSAAGSRRTSREIGVRQDSQDDHHQHNTVRVRSAATQGATEHAEVEQGLVMAKIAQNTTMQPKRESTRIAGRGDIPQWSTL